MKATKAIHNDVLTEQSAKGLIFEIKIGSKKFKLGITGDTKFFSCNDKDGDLCNQFKEIDVLIIHMGSIHKSEFCISGDNFENHEYKGGHLGIKRVVIQFFNVDLK
jgi:hypothetical protein